MAAKRGKSQARRNSGNNGGGLPGWAWGVLGLVLGVGLILASPRFLKSDGDGFFRPQPNPDAQPAPVAGEDDEVVAPDREVTARSDDKPAKADAGKPTDYDFYTLLPGKEVAMTEAELAATEQAEVQRAAQQAKAQAAAATTAPTAGASPVTTTATPDAALPRPVDEASAVRPAATAPTATTGTASSATAAAGTSPKPAAATAPTASAPTASAPTTGPSADDGSRYLLQAGAFQASGQAEELKAKIAMLGLGARVESAAINGKTVYRVRMGPYGTAGDLAEAKRKLASGGLAGMPIRVR